MRAFWDQRAKEDAFFFVDNRLAYGDPDLERFWADGERDLDTLLGALYVAVEPEDRVLEIGCGVGRLTRVLAARARAVQALDVSAQMLELAGQHNPELGNVKWILGDGSTLAGIESAGIDACVSHVVFQHIPDPAITLGYVRELGRVLRPGGWAAFQISNDPQVHRRPSLLERTRLAGRALARHAPQGQRDPRWLGSMVELDDLRAAAAAGSMRIERVVGEGTQFCLVLTRRLPHDA
ncbi:MAG TPA: class I SAM-dependent methyltransferase [Solirubrobacteraceae bacterium]|nr:class I SAM-dependent methyltransferase [Solirubrobacteraceae bacterium]